MFTETIHKPYQDPRNWNASPKVKATGDPDDSHLVPDDPPAAHDSVSYETRPSTAPKLKETYDC